MVSPFRIAREAQAVGGEGAEKFLDELLIWRELAYAFCFYTPHHDRWQALPDWARATLMAHANDRREHLTVGINWPTLKRMMSFGTLPSDPCCSMASCITTCE